MKLKNLANYTHQESQDVLTQVKAYLQVEEQEYADIILVNYQEQERRTVQHTLKYMNQKYLSKKKQQSKK